MADNSSDCSLPTCVLYCKVSGKTQAVTINKCVSCKKSIDKEGTLACGHRLCHSCSVDYMKNTKPCDVCRMVTGMYAIGVCFSDVNVYILCSHVIIGKFLSSL